MPRLMASPTARVVQVRSLSHLEKGSQPRTTHLPAPRSTLRITRRVTVAVLQPTFSVTVGAIDAAPRLVLGLLLWRAVHSC